MCMSALLENQERQRHMEEGAVRLSTKSQERKLSEVLRAWKLWSQAKIDLKQKAKAIRRSHEKLCMKGFMQEWSWQAAASKAQALEAEVQSWTLLFHG